MYNTNCFKHILKGSDEFINKGKEFVDKHYPLPVGAYTDSLLCQIGEAITNQDNTTLNDLKLHCENLIIEVNEYYFNKTN